MSSNWNWKLTQKGKVRDIYERADGNYIALVASDRVSASDEILPVEIEDKGKILTKISAFWFEWIKENLPDLPSAFVTIDNRELGTFFQKPEFKDRVTIMKKLDMLPIEAIVRGHITGSLWEAYKGGARDFCGIRLMNCLENSARLLPPLFTPTNKAPYGEHDKNIAFHEMVELLGEKGFANAIDLADSIQRLSLQLFDLAYDYAIERDIVIADTKFEFGVDERGKLYIADELFTPDSSRFWPREEFQTGRNQHSMDKQIIRDYVAAHKGETTIPPEILDQTKAQYEKCLKLLTS